MTAAGWIFMIISWGVILGMFAYCLSRTLRPTKKYDSTQDTEAQEEESGQ